MMRAAVDMMRAAVLLSSDAIAGCLLPRKLTA